MTIELLPQGTRVRFKDPVEGEGVICGISSIAQPIIGCGYIIKPDKPLTDYEYSHIVLFEHKLEIISDETEYTEAELQKILEEEDAEAAFYYANDEIGRRWPEAESFIAKDPEWAYAYAINVLDSRWPEAEDAICQDVDFAEEYAEEFGLKLKVIFVEDE